MSLIVMQRQCKAFFAFLVKRKSVKLAGMRNQILPLLLKRKSGKVDGMRNQISA
jgi:hypothetical protein